MQNCSLQKTSQQICRFLQNAVPCEIAEIFEFDDHHRTMVRLTDGTQYIGSDGGVSYQAGISAAVINVANNQTHPHFRKEIDGQLVNRALLSRSLHHGREHFVVTLRAKPNLPAFTTVDVRLLGELSYLICDALHLARWLESRERDRLETAHKMQLLSLCCSSLTSVAAQGTDRWATVMSVAKQLFVCETLFICLFDGRFMKFYPTDVQCKFEECAAGAAYNYRDTVSMSVADEKSRTNPGLYRQLGVRADSSISFPYRVNGRVAGAIEIINPLRTDVSTEEQKLFSNFCSCLMSHIH
jgi:hypothetical protein